MYAQEPAIEHSVDEVPTSAQVDAQADLEDIEVCNPNGQAPVLLLSDHSGRRIPDYLGDLGLPEAERARHIGWDIGTTDMTRHLARRLDAPAVLNHISRLVIDPNRVPSTETSIPEVADGTVVPGNQNLALEERNRRTRLSFIPYHRAISRQIARIRRTAPSSPAIKTSPWKSAIGAPDSPSFPITRAISRQIARIRRQHGIPVIIAMHSFTPAMQREWRPWEAGVLWDDDDRLAKPVLESLRAELIPLHRCQSALFRQASERLFAAISRLTHGISQRRF